MKKISTFLAVMMLAYGCTAERQNDTIAIDLSSSCDNQILSETIEDIRLVKLRTADDIIGNIDKIIVRAENIAVLDKNRMKIFIFDKTGELISTIDRKGRGPQEYLSAADIALTENGITVFDDGYGKLNLYDLEGNFSGSTEVCEGYCIAALDDGKTAVYSGYDADEYELSVFDQNGTLTGQYMEIDETLNGLPITVNNDEPLCTYDNRLLISRYFDYNIYEFDGKSTKAKYTFDFGADNFDPTTLQNLSPAMLHRTIIEDKSVQSIDHFVETPAWITFKARNRSVYYNKHDNQYIVLGQNLKMPYSALLSEPIKGYDPESGYFYTTLSMNNIINAFIPYLSVSSSGYSDIDALAHQTEDENSNDYVVLLKLKRRLSR